MANNIEWILKNYDLKDSPTTLIFLQSFHWEHVQFLLKDPSKKDEWEYYFGQFKEIDPKNIENKIKGLNKIFYKHWNKVSGFK